MAGDPENLEAIWRGLRAQIDQLATERQQYLAFFEQASEAYLVTDAEGTIQEANGAAVDIVQRRKLELRGAPLAALVALDHRPDFRQRLSALGSGDARVVRSWRTIIVAAQTRIEIELEARLIDRGHGVEGVCWRLQEAS